MLNRPTRIVGPEYTDPTLGTIRPVTVNTYDPLGHLTQVKAGRTDASGTTPASDVVTTQMTSLSDDFGRRLRETDALGRSWAFEYDVNHNLCGVGPCFLDNL
jgi:YD repeat-containing protein